MVATYTDDYDMNCATHNIDHLIRYFGLEKKNQNSRNLNLGKILEYDLITLSDKPGGKPILSVEKGEGNKYIVKSLINRDSEDLSKEKYWLELIPNEKERYVIINIAKGSGRKREILSTVVISDPLQLKNILINYSFCNNINEFKESLKPYEAYTIEE